MNDTPEILKEIEGLKAKRFKASIIGLQLDAKIEKINEKLIKSIKKNSKPVQNKKNAN